VTTILEALPAPLLQSVAACQACASMNHSHVLGLTNGPVPAGVMFVGEAPGRFGAGRSGVPFYGDESGRRFESLLAEAGLRREDVFITNAVLCNPLDLLAHNRRPLTSEVKRCLPFLSAQLEAVQPRVVVALGGVALEALRLIEPHTLELRSDAGRAIDWQNRRLVALYHPGRRAIVHRADALQRSDWRALGALITEFTRPKAEPALRPSKGGGTSFGHLTSR
jgi:uracil-DNA glycosylase family 4